MSQTKYSSKYKVRGYTGLLVGFTIGVIMMIAINTYVLLNPEPLNEYVRMGLLAAPIIVVVFLIGLGLFVARSVARNAEELQAAAEQSEKANEAKTMFLANMSHEIRTPLNAIIGFADILKKSSKEVQEREYADVIHRSANTLLSIINDILDLSKIEKGKIVLEFRSFDVHELMSQIVDLYTIRAESKGLRMLYVIDNKVPRMILGDSLRLSQVISNLLGNAIKFTPEGGTITLSVLMHEIYEEKVFLEFSVKDTGIGIPKEAQDKIFTPFSQADGGVTRTFGGTGLGLTISQKILQAMHSKLELESFLRQGSTFSFKVFFDRDLDTIVETDQTESKRIQIGLYPPRLAKHFSNERLIMILGKLGKIEYINDFGSSGAMDLICLFGHDDVLNDLHTAKMYYERTPMIFVGDASFIDEAERHQFAAYYKNPILESHLKSTVLELTSIEIQGNDELKRQYSGKVLVAEDNTTNRLLIQILLEKYGLSVDFAKDGYEAIAHADKQRYDLILMDIHMPKKDGIGATKEIILNEQDNALIHVPIVALTANALLGDREKYIEAGMDDYLSKPITDADLERILNKYLDTKSTASESVVEAQAPSDSSQALAYDAIDLTKQTMNLEYDPDAVANTIGVDRVTLDMLLENYFLTFEGDFNRLKNAVEYKDQKEIIEAAHYLKGASSNLHFDKGTEMFKDIERFARDGNLDWISLGNVEHYFGTVRESLGYK